MENGNDLASSENILTMCFCGYDTNMRSSLSSQCPWSLISTTQCRWNAGTELFSLIIFAGFKKKRCVGWNEFQERSLFNLVTVEEMVLFYGWWVGHLSCFSVFSGFKIFKLFNSVFWLVLIGRLWIIQPQMTVKESEPEENGSKENSCHTISCLMTYDRQLGFCKRFWIPSYSMTEPTCLIDSM